MREKLLAGRLHPIDPSTVRTVAFADLVEALGKAFILGGAGRLGLAEKSWKLVVAESSPRSGGGFDQCYDPISNEVDAIRTVDCVGWKTHLLLADAGVRSRDSPKNCRYQNRNPHQKEQPPPGWS